MKALKLTYFRDNNTVGILDLVCLGRSMTLRDHQMIMVNHSHLPSLPHREVQGSMRMIVLKDTLSMQRSTLILYSSSRHHSYQVNQTRVCRFHILTLTETHSTQLLHRTNPVDHKRDKAKIHPSKAMSRVSSKT